MRSLWILSWALKAITGKACPGWCLAQKKCSTKKPSSSPWNGHIYNVKDNKKPGNDKEVEVSKMRDWGKREWLLMGVGFPGKWWQYSRINCDSCTTLRTLKKPLSCTLYMDGLYIMGIISQWNCFKCIFLKSMEPFNTYAQVGQQLFYATHETEWIL